MQDLHSLKLYTLPANGGFKLSYPKSLLDPSFDWLEEELRDILILCNRHCSKLRKVQLLAGYVMTREFDGAPWRISKVDRLDNVEDLVF